MIRTREHSELQTKFRRRAVGSDNHTNIATANIGTRTWQVKQSQSSGNEEEIVNSRPVTKFCNKLNSIPTDEWRLRTQAFEALVTSLPNQKEWLSKRATVEGKKQLNWYESANTLRKLHLPVSVLLLDVRSMVVKHTCEQLVFLVKRISCQCLTRASSSSATSKNKNENDSNISNNHPCRLLLKDLLPTILLLHSQTVKVIHTYASDMMTIIIPACPFRAGLPILLERMRNDKNLEVRRICLRYLTLVLQHWTRDNILQDGRAPSNKATELKSYLTPSLRLRIGKGISRSLTDPSEEVRTEAHLAYKRFQKNLPQLYDRINNKSGNNNNGGGRDEHVGGRVRDSVAESRRRRIRMREKRLQERITSVRSQSRTVGGAAVFGNRDRRRDSTDVRSDGDKTDTDNTDDGVSLVPVGWWSNYTLETVSRSTSWSSVKSTEQENETGSPSINPAPAFEDVMSISDWQQHENQDEQHDEQSWRDERRKATFLPIPASERPQKQKDQNQDEEQRRREEWRQVTSPSNPVLETNQQHKEQRWQNEWLESTSLHSSSTPASVTAEEYILPASKEHKERWQDGQHEEERWQNEWLQATSLHSSSTPAPVTAEENICSEAKRRDLNYTLLPSLMNMSTTSTEKETNSCQVEPPPFSNTPSPSPLTLVKKCKVRDSMNTRENDEGGSSSTDHNNFPHASIDDGTFRNTTTTNLTEQNGATSKLMIKPIKPHASLFSYTSTSQTPETPLTDDSAINVLQTFADNPTKTIESDFVNPITVNTSVHKDNESKIIPCIDSTAERYDTNLSYNVKSNSEVFATLSINQNHTVPNTDDCAIDVAKTLTTNAATTFDAVSRILLKDKDYSRTSVPKSTTTTSVTSSDIPSMTKTGSMPVKRRNHYKTTRSQIATETINPSTLLFFNQAKIPETLKAEESMTNIPHFVGDTTAAAASDNMNIPLTTPLTNKSDVALAIAEELDVAHKLYINELMAKLQLEMDAMRKFNSILSRAKRGNGGFACSSSFVLSSNITEGGTAIRQRWSATDDSERTEITEDEVLRYFETIYNFLDNIDEKNTKLRRVLEQIGSGKEKVGSESRNDRSHGGEKTSDLCPPSSRTIVLKNTTVPKIISPLLSMRSSSTETETIEEDNVVAWEPSEAASSKPLSPLKVVPPEPLIEKPLQPPENAPKPASPMSFASITDWVNHRFWQANSKNDYIVKSYWMSGMTELNLTDVQLCEKKKGDYISDNEVGETDIDILAKLLHRDATLTKLYLGSNHIIDRGCETIMKALESNTALTHLDLRNNTISDQACQSITETLTKNISITDLCLMNNCISNQGLQMLMKGLGGNSSITTLDLIQNDNITDHALLRHCTSLVERNDVMKRHREQVATIGIAHYIVIDRESGEGYGQLRWARNVEDGGETHVEEAATIGDGWASVIFYDVLRSVISGNLRDDEPRLLSDSLIIAIRCKEKLKKLLNTRIGDSYILHLFLRAEHPSTLDLCKYLVYECGADFDSLDRSHKLTAQTIASKSTDPCKIKWAMEFGSLFGRYQLVKYPVIYRSSTCLVCEAVDIRNTEGDGSERVALKILYDHNDFMLEYKNYTEKDFQNEEMITDRSINHRFNEKYVSKLLRVYYVDTREVDRNTQKLLPEEQLKEGAKFRLLVMPMVVGTVADKVSEEQIAGRNYGDIWEVLHGIATVMKHINDKRLVYADARLENFVRTKTGEIKAIDFNATVPVGTKFTNKNHKGVCAPERAKILFHSSSDYLHEVNQLANEKNRTVKLMEKDSVNTDKARMRDLKKKYRDLDEEMDRLEELEEDAVKLTDVIADFTYDVWSFGCIMFELITSEKLFQCHTNGDIFDKEKHRLIYWNSLKPDDLRLVMQYEVDGNSGRSAINLLQKCLQGDPTTRYQSMAEVIKDPYFLGFET